MPATRSASPSCCDSRRRTAMSDAQTVSLADYVGRMKEGQDAIYYITADGFSAAKNSPHLEVFRKLGVEVLLMYDRVDEWVVSALTEFEGKPLQSVARGDLDLGKLGRRGRTGDAGDAARRVQGPARAHAGRAQGARQRRAGDAPPDRFAGLPGQRRARHQHEPRASAEGVGPEGADRQADPRDQPAASDRRATEGRIGRRAGSRTGATSCSIRRRWPRAVSSTTPRRS